MQNTPNKRSAQALAAALSPSFTHPQIGAVNFNSIRLGGSGNGGNALTLAGRRSHGPTAADSARKEPLS